MEYRQKDETTKGGDDAYSRPPTRGGGGRGGEGRGRGDRPNTRGGGRGRGREATGNKLTQGETPQKEYTRGGRGGRGRGGDGQTRGGGTDGATYQGAGAPRTNNRRQIDETSFQWRFFNEERKTYDKVAVNADTVIEELPSIADTLKKPSKEEFDRKMRALDKLIDEKKIIVEKNKLIKRGVFEGGKIDGSNLTYRDSIIEQGEAIKKIRNERRSLLDEMNKLKDRQRELDAKKQDYMKNIPRNYHNIKDLNSAIKAKQTSYETGTMNNNEEKQLLKDIDSLKKAVPDMEKLSQIEPELSTIKEKRKAIQKSLDVIHGNLDGKEADINKVKQDSQKQRDQRDEVKANAEQYQTIIDSTNEEIQNSYKSKDETREGYYKGMFEFDVQNDKIRWIRGLRNQKKALESVTEDRQDRIAKKREEIANSTNPNEKQVETCDHLIKYCNKLKQQSGLAPQSSEEVAKELDTQMKNDWMKQDLQQKLKDGKIQAVVKKDESIQVGNKGKKGKKQRQPKAGGDQGISVDFALITKFGVVGVSPPVHTSELDTKIEELTVKMKQFTEEGSKFASQDKAKLEAEIEKMVDADLETERKAAEAEYGDEEEKTEDKPQVVEKKYKKPKGEFDDSEDEEFESVTASAYAAPSRGGRGGGGARGGRGGKGGNRKQAKIDDDNDFPSL